MAALLNGISSSGTEAGGFNAIIKPNLLASPQLTRVSDTVVTIYVPSMVDYDISQPETISIVIPPTTVQSRQVAYFALPFLMYPATPRATLSSDAGLIFSEIAMQTAEPVILQVHLSGCNLASAIGQISWTGIPTTIDLRHGLQPVVHSGYSPQPTGWASMVSPQFLVTDLSVVSPVVFNISVRQSGSYQLSETESIRLTMPPSSVQYNLAPVVATPVLQVSPAGAHAEIGGTLLSQNDEVSLRAPFASAAADRLTIEITLFGAEWGPYLRRRMAVMVRQRIFSRVFDRRNQSRMASTTSSNRSCLRVT